MDLKYQLSNRLDGVAHHTGWCRSQSVKHADTAKSKNWRTFAGGSPKHPAERHILSAHVEVAYSMFSSWPIDRAKLGKGDVGIDFPCGVEVKSSDQCGGSPRMLFYPKELEDKVFKSKRRGDPLRFLVMGYVEPDDCRIVTLMGAVTVAEYMEHRYHDPKLRSNGYAMDSSWLRPLEDVLTPDCFPDRFSPWFQ